MEALKLRPQAVTIALKNDQIRALIAKDLINIKRCIMDIPAAAADLLRNVDVLVTLERERQNIKTHIKRHGHTLQTL